MDLVKHHRILLLSVLMLSLVAIPQRLQNSVSAGAASPTAQPINPSAQLQSRPQDGVFVMRQEMQRVECQKASPIEAQALMADGEPELQVINNPVTSASRLTKAKGLTLILRGTSQLERHPEAKAALRRAAATWMALIKNKITLTVDVDFGPTHFGAAYPEDVLGIASVQEVSARGRYPEIRQRLVETAKNERETALYQALPQDSLTPISGTTKNIAAPSAVFRSLGLLAATADAASESAMLGAPPAISFNSAFPFDFDARDGIDADKIDFEGLVSHQIGHLLGFVSEQDVQEDSPTKKRNYVTTWDLFRFQPERMAGSFTAVRQIPTGAKQGLLTTGNNASLADGRFLGQAIDDESASHWKTGRPGDAYLGVMESSLRFGQQLTITQNDREAMEYIGHTVGESADEADDTIALTSGTPMAGTVPEPDEDSCMLNPVQYTIQVPSTATALKVDLVGVPELDLFLRINGYVVAIGPNVWANFYSISTGGSEKITIEANPGSTLPAGTYYIGIGNCGAGAGNFTLTATVTKPNIPPTINTFAARLDGDTLNLSGTAVDEDGDIVKATIKLIDAAGSETITLPNVPVSFDASQNSYSMALKGLAQASALSVVKANLVLTDAAGNNTSAMTASFNQPDAGGAVIKNVSFDGDVMVFKGSPFVAGMKVEVNGVVVTPPLNLKLKGAKLKLAGTISQLGLVKGTNRVRLSLNGAYSNLFLLKN